MQKIATKVFIGASVIFGIVGIAYWITIPHDNEPGTNLNHTLLVILGATVAVVLSSFALSVAGKYLKDD